MLQIQSKVAKARIRGRATFRNRIIGMLLTVLVLTLSFSSFSISASAAAAVSVKISGALMTEGKARMIDSTTYVPFRAFCKSVDEDAGISWNASTKTATARSSDHVVSAKSGKNTVVSNGKTISGNGKSCLISGSLYVPIRTLAAAYSYEVSWQASTRTAVLKPKSGGTTTGGSSSSGSSSSGSATEKPSTAYSENDLYWLSRIIEAEAGGEPYRGKLAVGAVIMNRVRSSSYPNTIYGVIFDKKYGTQFTPAATGTIYCTPSADSIAAAKEVLNGNLISREILYFLNPRLASDTWFKNNLTYVFTIGNHVFYAE